MNDEGADQAAELAIGRRARELREHRRFSQQHVAAAMTVKGHRWHQTTVAKTETGERPLRLSEARALSQLLHVQLGDLLGEGPSRHERGLAIGELQRLAQQIEDRVRELEG